MIRRATADDAANWFALRLAALQAHPDAYGSSFAEECTMPLTTVIGRLTDPLNRVWVVEEHGQLIGTATARREGFAKGAHRTNLFAMYVKPEARQRGLGKQLVQAVIGSARHDLAADWLQLTVACQNIAAIKLYQALGFTITGQQHDAMRVDGQSIDEYQMALDLRATTGTPHE